MLPARSDLIAQNGNAYEEGLREFILPTEGALPYQRDLERIEVHLLDTGHFALGEDGPAIADHIRRFLGTHLLTLEDGPASLDRSPRIGQDASWAVLELTKDASGYLARNAPIDATPILVPSGMASRST